MDQDYLQKLVDEMPIGLLKFKVVWDKTQGPVDSQVVFINQTTEQLFDMKRVDILGKTLIELSNSNNLKARAFAQTGIANLNTKRNVPFYHVVEETKRTYKVILKSAEPGHVNAMMFDVTEEILLENQSKKYAESMENFYSFFNAVYDMLFILDEQGNIIHANKTVFDRLGFTEDDLYGKTVLQVHPEERRAEAFQNVLEMLQGAREYCPIPIITKTGKPIAVETRVKTGQWDGKPVLFGVVKDITDLRISEEKFSKAFHNSGSLMVITQLSDNQLIEVNDAFCDKLGYSRQEIIGNNTLQLGLFRYPEERQKYIDQLQLTPSIRNVETEIVTKSRKIINGLFNIDLIYLGSELCMMTSMTDITVHVKKEEEVRRNNLQLTDLVNEKVKEIAEAQLATISALSNITESRDNDTGNHVERLKEGCKLIAEKLSENPQFKPDITSEFISKLQYASVIHDIGKVGIKDSILLKPGKLNADEFDHIKTHPIIGANVLKQVYQSYPGNKYIETGIEIAESHHERWDGKGYPYQLKEDQIPLSAQILAVCDVYDALRSKRPYKEPFDHETSLKQILDEKGTHFNPQIVDAFMACEADFKALYIKFLHKK